MLTSLEWDADEPQACRRKSTGRSGHLWAKLWAAMTAKQTLRAAIAAPGVRHALRWFLRRSALPERWRRFAHRKLAKRARFGERTFRYTTSSGRELELLHGGTASYLYWLGEYEPETTSLFCRLAERAEIVLDIGAA